MVDPIDVVDREGRGFRQEQVAGIGRRLKCLARDLDIPIIVTAGLNRQRDRPVDVVPTLADLGNNIALEKEADLIVLLHRPNIEAGHSYNAVDEAKVVKHRHGPTGDVTQAFLKRFLRFEENLDQFIH